MAFGSATAIELDQEQRLIEEAQRGHLDAMRPLLERYAGPLYGAVILPRLGSSAAAEEVLRDTLSTAVEKISRFTWQGKGLFPWLRMIAINKIVDRHRHDARGRRIAEALAREADDEASAGASPDALLMAEQDRRLHRSRIDQTLLALPDRYRLAIELRLIEELPREECARRLEVTLGTFDVLLFRAVRSFRKHFGDRVPEEASP
ncbi:MAG: RNA polymerase sigma factor [Kofleriaceae bacterium]|nr:RNA polymerase sigma factor [Kofleriaceae bacterium]MBP6838852.1 RNA polymerase sigma factor [Kofleriaceae bacterium]MBP9205660.1 RNA polymerase sigma factor [Kofleriaceae bacterium]